MGKVCYTVCQAPCRPDPGDAPLPLPVFEAPRATSRVRFSHPRLYELARDPQTASGNRADTESITRGLSDPTRLQSIDEHTHRLNQHPEVVPRPNHTPAPVALDPVPVVLPIPKPVLTSRKRSSRNSDLPHVKVLLCGDPNDTYSAADIKRFNKNCLEYVKGVRRRNIKICLGKDSIRKKFDWFFDPDGIAPGGLLILCVIGHGMRTAEGVEIRIGITREKIMDTFDLHSEINKLQNPCTLEIFFATCTSEAIISGLDRLLVMDVSEAHPGSQDVQPPSSVLFKGLFSPHIPKLSTKAIVIVWAAAVDEGPAYEEASLPGREGRNDIMIGAICRALEAAGQTIPRRMLFEKICENVAEYNVVRDERHFTKSREEQRRAQETRRYGGPQCICLLGTLGDQELILDGHALQAVGNVQTA